MKVYLFIAVLVSLNLVGLMATAQTSPAWNWAMHDSINESPVAMATDAAGNIYTAGYSFTKRSPTGALVWSVKLSNTTQFVSASDLAIDGTGNLYLCGNFFGTVMLDTITLNSSGRRDIFVAKFNSSGRVQWARKAGGPGPPPSPPSPGYIDDAAYGIAVDPAGNTYITGVFHTTFNTTVHFDSITVFPNSGRGFVAKYNPAGKIREVYLLGNMEGVKVASGPLGSVYVALGNGGEGLCKFYANGSLAWNRPVVTTGYVHISSLRADQAGNCYITGGFTGGSANFGTSTLNSGNSFCMFLTKYDGSGTVEWATQSTGAWSSAADNLALDSQGQPYITGSLTGITNFGPNLQLTGGSSFSDIFVAKYSATGVPLWAQMAGGNNGHDYGMAISVLPNDECLVTGIYNNSCVFGSTVLVTPFPNSMFIAKLSASPLGISEKSAANNFQLYPNPANVAITIRSNQSRIALLEIYNLTGQQVYKVSFQTETKLNVARFPAGMYLVKITSEGKTETQKLIVTH